MSTPRPSRRAWESQRGNAVDSDFAPASTSPGRSAPDRAPPGDPRRVPGRRRPRPLRALLRSPPTAPRGAALQGRSAPAGAWPGAMARTATSSSAGAEEGSTSGASRPTSPGTATGAGLAGYRGGGAGGHGHSLRPPAFSPLLAHAWLLGSDAVAILFPAQQGLQRALASPPWRYLASLEHAPHPEYGLGLDFWPGLLRDGSAPPRGHGRRLGDGSRPAPGTHPGRGGALARAAPAPASAPVGAVREHSRRTAERGSPPAARRPSSPLSGPWSSRRDLGRPADFSRERAPPRVVPGPARTRPRLRPWAPPSRCCSSSSCWRCTSSPGGQGLQHRWGLVRDGP